MAQSTTTYRRALLFDKALELRDYAGDAIAASQTENAIPFPATKQLGYKAVVDVAAITGVAAGTAQWDISVEVSATAGGNYKEVAKVTPGGIANRFDLPLSGEWVNDVVPEALYIRIKATKTGTPGNLSYGAFLCC